MSRYAFDNAAVEPSTDRFNSLQHCYDGVSIDRLSALGVGESWRCLEIGAGGGSIANWLGRRVGHTGSVLATDIDVGLIGDVVDNVEVRQHDIVRDALPESEFDLVHARLVLLHLPERRTALHRIWHALKPGGFLLLDEFDCTWQHVFTAPDASSARLFERVSDGVLALLREAGADLAWGRNAYAALAETGYVDLSVTGFAEVWEGGSVGIHLHRANARHTATQLVEKGLATETEIADYLELLEDPRLAVNSQLMLSTTGRRPA